MIEDKIKVVLTSEVIIAGGHPLSQVKVTLLPDDFRDLDVMSMPKMFQGGTVSNDEGIFLINAQDGFARCTYKGMVFQVAPGTASYIDHMVKEEEDYIKRIDL